MMDAWWTIITRHEWDPAGTWRQAGVVYDTRERATRAGHDLWDGTGVTWRLMSIPLE
jgi:hypothetical protein